MIYLELFLSFFQMGLFGFGGGYAVLPLIKEQVVIQHPWLTMSEFTDLITISQMTPGPIVVNSATFIGLRIAGVGGAFVAPAGSILPSCSIRTLCFSTAEKAYESCSGDAACRNTKGFSILYWWINER